VGTISISIENGCHSEEQRDEETAFVVVHADSEILALPFRIKADPSP
jgi:hypothetical protein